MVDKLAEQTESKTVLYTIPQEYLYHPEDEISFATYINWFKRWWRTIFLISFVGTGLSVFLALSMTKIFESKVVLSTPSEFDVSKFTNDGMINYDAQTLFQKYYSEVRAPERLRQFIIEKGYVEAIFSDEDRQAHTIDVLMSAFLEDFSVEILEPVAGRDEFIGSPTQISLSLKHENESLIVNLLNEYIEHVNHFLIDNSKVRQSEMRDLQIRRKETEILLAREDAKNRRELLIKKLSKEISVEVNRLEQERRLLVEKAASDRMVTVNNIEAENQVKLEELEQRKEILIQSAKANRMKSIAEAEEARKIADKLGIVNPTRLDDLVLQQKPQSVTPNTEIKLSDSESLPLYLMGTNYLDTLIKTLSEREDDTRFLSEIAEIEGEIKMVRDDIRLAALKARDDDEKYLEQLNEIDKKIAILRNDPVLLELKIRVTDDPFIENLPKIQSDIAALKAMTFNFDGLKMYTLGRAAYLTNKAVEPNRKLVALIGAVFSVFIALFVAFVRHIVTNNTKPKD